MIREKLIDRIRNRLPASDAAEVIASLQRAVCDEVFDHLSARHGDDIVARYRDDARYALREYRLWRYRDALSKLTRAFHDREGEMLRQRAGIAASLYLDARRDQRDLASLADGNVEHLRDEALADAACCPVDTVDDGREKSPASASNSVEEIARTGRSG